MEPDNSLICSQESAIGHYPEPNPNSLFPRKPFQYYPHAPILSGSTLNYCLTSHDPLEISGLLETDAFCLLNNHAVPTATITTHLMSQL
jgi:hypothetical protein